MSMQGMKETIDKLQDLIVKSITTENPIIEHCGKNYWADSKSEIQPKTYRDHIKTHSLQSIVDYIEFGLEDSEIKKEDIFIVIDSIDQVSVYLKVDSEQKRTLLLRASLDSELKSFKYDVFMETEPFIIGLYSLFVDSEERAKAIQKASALKLEVAAGEEDNGSSSRITARSEVKTGNDSTIFILAPYRTFREVSQPSSGFVFRVNKQLSCALFEADGGAWRIESLKLIKNWLKDKVKDITVIG